MSEGWCSDNPWEVMVRIFPILTIVWLVAICVTTAAVVPSVVLLAQCTMLGAAGNAVFGLGRIGQMMAMERTWSKSALIPLALRPVCGAAIGWATLVILTLLLRLIVEVPVECANSVRVMPATAWLTAFIAGFTVDLIRKRRCHGGVPQVVPCRMGGPLQDGENGYNDPAL